MNHVFTHQNLVIEYLIFGTGDETLLCFHGFGRKAEDFEVFLPLLKEHQRIISINLFAHQNSFFPEERIEKQPLLPQEWKALIDAFCIQMHIRKFHLFGYSMGGRICLKTLELMPERVSSVLLIAPDGLKVNMLYRFASGTALGRWMYRKLIDNPKPLFAVADFLHALKLLSHKLHRFTYVHLDTKEKRQQVHDAWLIYKRIFPDLHKLATIINNSDLPFNMIFGKYDSVIRPQLGAKFSVLIGSEKHLHIIEAGHRLMTEQTVKFIAEKKLWP